MNKENEEDWSTLRVWLHRVMKRIQEDRREPALQSICEANGLGVDDIVERLEGAIETFRGARSRDDTGASARVARIHTVLVEEIGRWEEQVRVCASRRTKLGE